MTRYTPQWLQAGSYPASLDRRLLGALWPAAAVSGMTVSPAGGMLLNVAAGQAAVPTANNTGSVLCSSDAVEQVVLGAAPGAGTNRIDVVTVMPRGNDLDGGANTDFIFNVIAGAAVASPVAPAVPAGQVAIANVFVGGGVAAIVAANITDVRPLGLAVGGSAALPPPLGAGAPTQGYTDPSGEVWVAKGGVVGGAWRKARDVLSARVFRNAAFTVAATETPFSWDSVSYDPFAMWAGSTVTVPLAGLYRVTAVLTGTATASGQWMYIVLLQNGSGRRTQGQQWASAAGGMFPAFADQIRCAAGDTVSLGVRAVASLTGLPGEVGNNISVAYTGTG
jgi:hypothetical protein